MSILEKIIKRNIFTISTVLAGFFIFVELKKLASSPEKFTSQFERFIERFNNSNFEHEPKNFNQEVKHPFHSHRHFKHGKSKTDLVKTGDIEPESEKYPANPTPWLRCIRQIETRQVDVLSDILSRKHNKKYPLLLIDPAYHDNIGDNLQVLGELKYFIKFGWGANTINTCNIAQGDGRIRSCHDFSNFTKSRVAIWHAGGNWGNMWSKIQHKRLESFKFLLKQNKTIISMPQSMHFTEEKFLAKDAATFKNICLESGLEDHMIKDNVILTWRQYDSYQLASKYYNFVQNRLMPDISFQIGPIIDVERYPQPKYPIQKVDILLILRTDKESILNGQENSAEHRHDIGDLRNNHFVQKRLDYLERSEVSFKIVDWKDRTDYYHHSGIFATPSKAERIEFDFDTRIAEAMSLWQGS